MHTNENDKKRIEKLEKICEKINKGTNGGLNKDAVSFLGTQKVRSLERFGSGCPDLDDALGGGYPVGRFVEFFGPESCGKTTHCLHAIAEFQKAYPGQEVAFLDSEYAFDEEYAKNIGIDTRWLIVHQPDSGEQCLNVLKELVEVGVKCAVVDSVAALTSQEEMDKSFGDATVGVQARLMSKALRQLAALCGRNKCTVFFTNQTRDKIGVQFGNPETTPGGKALKFYASLRLRSFQSHKSGEKDKQGEWMSTKITTDVVKNKTSPPYRRATYFMTYGKGIDRIAAIFDGALNHGVIEKRGSWFAFDGKNLGQGRDSVLQELRGNDELVKKIAEATTKAKTVPSDIVRTPLVDTSESQDAKTEKKTPRIPHKKPSVSLSNPSDASVEIEDA